MIFFLFVSFISGYLLFSDTNYSKGQNIEYVCYLSMHKLN